MDKQEPKEVKEVVSQPVTDKTKELVYPSVEEVIKAQQEKIEKNLDALIDKRVNDRLSEREKRVEEARSIIEDAERRKRLNEELENKVGHETIEWKRKMLETRFKELINVFNDLIDQGNYPVGVFNKPDGTIRDNKASYFREFAYAARTFGPEKMLEYYKKNYIGLRNPSVDNIIVPNLNKYKYF